MRYVMTAVALMCAAAPAAAQTPDAAVAAKQAVERQAMDVAKKAAEGQSMRIAVESQQPKGAPYSAEATTESVQVLADGNRIVTKSGTRIYRDSDGRTRREQLNATGTDAMAINISDPVAGNSFVLDPASHTAYRNGLVFARVGGTAGAMSVTRVASDGNVTRVVRTPEAGAMVVTRDQVSKEAAEAAVVEGKQVAEIRARVATTVAAAEGGGAGGPTTTFVSGGGGATVAAGALMPRMVDGVGTTTRQDLGQQTIEGVTATGTRTITEIPAGTIGNEQPIKILSEQWFSPELQVLVMTKHSDPRSGDIIYRLTGIVRAEPSRSLFEVPPDYTLQESAIRRQQER